MVYSNTSKGRGIKGSKYWMQIVIENDALRQQLNKQIGDDLLWLSPLAGESETFDEYELKDHYITERFGLNHDTVDKIFCFWPKRQPQWDSLAVNTDGKALYLVEAKAHLTELGSMCSAKNPESRKLIESSMKDIHDRYYPDGDFEAWMNKYYQLGNRLTFVKTLNETSFGPVKRFKLVLLNFVNDNTYIPTLEYEWKNHYNDVFRLMIGEEQAPDDVLVIQYDVRNK